MKKFNLSFFYLFFGRILQTGLSVLTVRLMTELLDTQEVGHQYLINSLILGFSLILVNPVGMFINRHLHQWKSKNQLLAAVKEMNIYFLFVALISLPVTYALRTWYHFSEESLVFHLVSYVGLYLFLSTWFQTVISFFNLLGFQGIFVSLNIFSILFGLISAVGMTHFFGPQGLFWLVGLLVGQFVSLILGLFLLIRKLKDQFELSKSLQWKIFSKEAFLFCYPVALTTIFMWWMTQGYRFWIEENLGFQVLASIGVGLGLAASLASIVESLTTQWLYPFFYSQLDDKGAESRRKSWELLWQRSMGIYIPFLFVSFGSASLVIRLLVSEKFQNVSSIFYIGCCIEFLRMCSNVLYIAAHSEKKTTATIGPFAFGATALLIFLFGLQQLSILTERNALGVLVLANLSTFIFNLVQVKKLLQVCLLNKNILKISLISFPVLFIVLIPLDKNDVLSLILVNAFAGVYSSYVVYRNLKRTQIFDYNHSES